MSLHPEHPDIDQEYDRAVGELGCRGIKLALSYQAVDPMSAPAFRLFGRLQSDGLPIVFHNGMSASSDAVLRYAHPLGDGRGGDRFSAIDDGVGAHVTPLVRGLHGGCAQTSRTCGPTSQACRRDLGWHGERCACSTSSRQRTRCCSDRTGRSGLRRRPWTDCAPSPDFAKEHKLPPVPEDEIEAIINRNSLELLGLE